MMETTINISIILGSILSLLFSMIAFFTRQLYMEFKKVEINLAEIRTSTEVIKATMHVESIRIKEYLAFQDKRIEHLESVGK